MLFSVIIPVYNVKKYLDECVNSILNQTYNDFELILVDDGSTDGSAEICDKYLFDSRVRVIHKENGGHSSARQAGFLESKAEYCCFVDSDDFVALDFLETFNNIIQEYHPDVIESGFERFSQDKSEISFSCDEGYYIGDKLKMLQSKLVFNSEKQAFNNGSIFYSLCTKCIKKSLLETFIFSVDKDIVMGEDMAITMPLVCACQSLYVKNFAGYKYRDNPTSIVNTFRHQDYANCKKLVKFLDAKMPNHKKQISCYFYDFTRRYSILAARSSTSFKNFKYLTKDNIKEEDFNRIKKVKIKGETFKNKISGRLVKLRFWFLIWLFCKL